MFEKIRGILEVIEYLDPTGQEIVHRVPEDGSGEIVLGSQCIVREKQVAIFFRDGRSQWMIRNDAVDLQGCRLDVCPLESLDVVAESLAAL